MMPSVERKDKVGNKGPKKNARGRGRDKAKIVGVGPNGIPIMYPIGKHGRPVKAYFGWLVVSIAWVAGVALGVAFGMLKGL